MSNNKNVAVKSVKTDQGLFVQLSNKVTDSINNQQGSYTAVKQVRTMDGFQNFVARVGLRNDNALSASHYAFDLITRNRFQLEAAYRGSWICGAVIDAVSEDMTREGIEIASTDNDESVMELEATQSRLGVWDSLRDCIAWGDLYGGSIGLIQIAGQDNATPLDPESVGEGDFLGIIPYDRWQLNPDVMTVIDQGPEMGLPEYYYITTNNNINDPASMDTVGGIKIHHSRVIRFTGIKLPFWQAITEMMWGESVLERMWDRLISFDNTTLSAANLVNKASLRMMKIDRLREIVAAGGPAYEGLVAQMEAMREFQLNEGLTMIDKEDEFSTDSYTFGGLDSVLLQFGQQLSGASRVPLVRLFGQSPAGLNATGEADMRMYYDGIAAKQKSKLRNGVELLITVLYRSTFGKPRPKGLTWKFKPLWQMSDLDKATIAKTTTETIIGAYEANLTTRPTAMKELRDSSQDTGLFGNISDEEIEDAEDEAENPPMPVPGAQPGQEMPGGKEQPNGEPTPEKIAKPVPSLDAAYEPTTDIALINSVKAAIKRWYKRQK